jgi:hypothetical protein
VFSQLRGMVVYRIMVGKFEVDRRTKCVSSVRSTLFYRRRLSAALANTNGFFFACSEQPVQHY